MTAERDSTMTLVHRQFADSLEKESKRAGLPDGWADVLTAAYTSIRTLADAIDAHLTTHDAVVSDEAVAWLHDVVQGDGEPDQALSFYRDSFPLDTELGFRSLGAHPLFIHPIAPRKVSVSHEDVERAVEVFQDHKLNGVIYRQCMRAALESLASRKVAVPEGWMLVPIEPTEAMKLAGQTAHYEAEEACRIEIAEADIFANKEKPGTMRRRKNRAAFVYKRMLANAPEAMLASQDEVK